MRMGDTAPLLLQHCDSGNQYSAGFKGLRKDRELFDITLATDDDIIDAHKVLLSACSPTFRKIVSKTPSNGHPFIYMKGVNSEHLKVIIDFVYDTEVRVPSSELQKILDLAQELEINGLAQVQDREGEMIINNDPSEAKYISTDAAISLEEKSLNSCVDVPVDASINSDNVECEINTEDEDFQFQDFSVIMHNKSEETDTEESVNIKINIDQETLERLDQQIKKNLRVNRDGRKKTNICKFCEQKFKSKQKAITHIEGHLEEFVFPCELCNKVLNTRKGLRSHIIYNHTKKDKEFQNEDFNIKLEKSEDVEQGNPKVSNVNLNIDDETLTKLAIKLKENTIITKESDGRRKISCKLCGKEYPTKQKLKDHIETHLDDFTFTCEYCNQALSTRRGLRSHIIYNHIKKDKENMNAMIEKTEN